MASVGDLGNRFANLGGAALQVSSGHLQINQKPTRGFPGQKFKALVQRSDHFDPETMVFGDAIDATEKHPVVRPDRDRFQDGDGASIEPNDGLPIDHFSYPGCQGKVLSRARGFIPAFSTMILHYLFSQPERKR